MSMLTLIRSIGINIQSIDLLVYINILFGVMFLVVCFLIIRRIFGEWQIGAYVGVLIIGCSYTFGAYSRNADPYVIPTTIIAFVMFRILRNVREKNVFEVSIFDWVLVLIATLFHQISLLFVPALIYAQIQSSDSRKSVIMCLRPLCFSVAFAAIYALVFILTKPVITIPAFRQWVVGYAGRDFWVFSETKQVISALTASFYEGLISHKALFLAPMNREALRLWEYRVFHLFDYEESFGLYGGWIVFLEVLIFIFKGAHMLYDQAEYRRLFIFMFIYVMPFVLLFQLFAPYNHFYRLFYILPLVIIMIKGVSEYWGESKLSFSGVDVFNIIVVMLLSIYLTINFAFGFFPERKEYNNPLMRFAHEISKETPEESLFIFHGYPDVYFKYRTYLRYFASRDVFVIWQFKTGPYSKESIHKIDEKAKKTGQWLTENYKTVYIVEQDDVEFSSYNLITPPDSKPEYPTKMLLREDQIPEVLPVNIGGMNFYKYILE